jgi:hypothetical protein
VAVKRVWALDELTELFPGAAERHARHLCTRHVSGEGRWIKESGTRRQFGHVRLHVEPAEVITVHLEHEWPATLPTAEIDGLDMAVLRGVSESPSAPPRFLYGYRLVIDAVEYRAGETTPMTVTLAASLAALDALKRGGWDHPGVPDDAA